MKHPVEGKRKKIIHVCKIIQFSRGYLVPLPTYIPGNVGGQKKVNGSLEETVSSSKFIGLVGFFLNGFGKATNFPSVPNHLDDL